MTLAPAVDSLLRFRDRFPILKRTKYLVSHSLGAMPEATKDALEEYADLWASRGVRAWGDKWWLMSIEVGDIIAPLIGAPRGSVVMLPNVTTAEVTKFLRAHDAKIIDGPKGPGTYQVQFRAAATKEDTARILRELQNSRNIVASEFEATSAK